MPANAADQPVQSRVLAQFCFKTVNDARVRVPVQDADTVSAAHALGACAEGEGAGQRM